MTRTTSTPWRPRAVLFDLDDTLLATREIKWRQHIAVARDAFGIELTEATLRQHYGKPWAQMVTEIYGHAPLDEIRAAIDAVKDDHLKQPHPGAAALVTRLLDAGIAVGVVTASQRADAAEDLVRCGFPAERLTLLQGADDTDVHKPDPRVFDPALARLAELGIEPAETCYVGDGVVDRDAAHAAGLCFFAVAQGMYPVEEFTDDPAVATIAELEPLLLGR